MQSMINNALRILEQYNLRRNIYIDEPLAYLEGPTYENDTISFIEILGYDLLFLHEIAEAYILENMGYDLSCNTIIEAYPDTYLAHLKALEIELLETGRRKLYKWIKQRCKVLKSYLNDPHLPSILKNNVYELISRFCQ